MRILHYSLGFPLYRTGGMTKYCMDLMETQKKMGHKVALLWPGKIKKNRNNVLIKKKRQEKGFDNFEIINPMPVPLLEGIREVEEFTKTTDQNVYIDFFESNEFDVIHLHTLMGLPKEFLEVAKVKGIKTIFTSHDYFGICPKVSLLYNDKICRYDKNCTNCESCNETALSLNNIRIRQSVLFRNLKKFKFINKLNKYNYIPIKAQVTDSDNEKNNREINNDNLKYVNLRNYYMEMFSLLTKIHFNSHVTENVYREFGVRTEGKVISISHGEIKDCRKTRDYGDKIRFGYLGPASERKGFFLLKNVLDSIEKNHKGEFELHIYSKNCFDSDYIVAHLPYFYDEMPQVMDNIDILILPSVWYETFGFTVQEALSYGVPVMVSENVGAKDIIENYKTGVIFEANEEDLKEKILYVLEKGKAVLSDMNRNIVDNSHIKTIEEHTTEMLGFYKS